MCTAHCLVAPSPIGQFHPSLCLPACLPVFVSLFTCRRIPSLVLMHRTFILYKKQIRFYSRFSVRFLCIVILYEISLSYNGYVVCVQRKYCHVSVLSAEQKWRKTQEMKHFFAPKYENDMLQCFQISESRLVRVLCCAVWNGKPERK